MNERERVENIETNGPTSGVRSAEAWPVIARVDAISSEGDVFVRIGKTAAKRAWVASSLSLDELVAAAREGAPVLVQFVDGDPDQPVVIARLVQRLARAIEPDVLEISAKTSITLRTGQGAIEVHRDGTVAARGVRVSVEAEGPIELHGASIKLN